MVQALAERPPFVAFETWPEEDRNASIQAGHYVGRDIDYAFITPAGSKDRIQRVVKEWFEQLAVDVQSERFPAEWLTHYRKMYEAYKAGETVVPNGMPLRDWPGLSPALLKTLNALNLFAVEDVAAANEETITRMGMGGRSLKQRAVDYLAAAKNVGKVAEDASAMRAMNERLQATVDTQAEQLAALQRQVAALVQGGGGFGRQDSASTSAETSVSVADIIETL